MAVPLTEYFDVAAIAEQLQVFRGQPAALLRLTAYLWWTAALETRSRTPRRVTRQISFSVNGWQRYVDEQRLRRYPGAFAVSCQ